MARSRIAENQVLDQDFLSHAEFTTYSGTLQEQLNAHLADFGNPHATTVSGGTEYQEQIDDLYISLATLSGTHEQDVEQIYIDIATTSGTLYIDHITDVNILHNKIDTTSGTLNNYITSVSGSLDQDITELEDQHISDIAQTKSRALAYAVTFGF